MRRIHYSGKYPKHFQEKYKELQPDKYGAMAEHVTRKGNTPAGTHLPIMVREILGPATRGSTRPWATAATRGPCWTPWRGGGICAPPM